MTSALGEKRLDAELAAEHKSQIERAAVRAALCRGLIAAGFLAAGILAIVARSFGTGLILLGSAGTVGLLFLDAILHKNEVAHRSARSLAPNLSVTLGQKDESMGSAHTDVTK